MIKRTRIMYIESKAEGLNGPARIGRVTFNRTGRTLSLTKVNRSIGYRASKPTIARPEAGRSTGFQAPAVMGWTVFTGKVRWSWR
jgi:hypothetical protein